MAPPMTLWNRQSFGSDVENAKNAFSSWNGCMSADYCKYPVIVAIIVASLIALSVLICIVRCCCCGMECCCSICSCCNACCPSPRNRRGGQSKYADQPGPYNNAGYQPPAPLSYATPAQYAQFDVSKKGSGPGGLHEDALPAMPSWDSATSQRVPDESAHEESHEMNQMTPQEEQNAPMLAHQAPSPGVHGDAYAAGAAPYHDLSGPNPDAFVAGAAAPSPYGQDNQHPGNQYNDPYARQDQQNPLNRYGQNAVSTPPPRPGPSPFASQQSYSSGPSPYGSAQGSYNQGYGQEGYGAQAHSPPLQQSYGHPSPPPQYNYASSPPPPVASSALPSALQSGATSSSPVQQPSYQPYGGAYSQAQSRPQYSAYNPNASETASTRYEPSTYNGSAAGQRPGQGRHDWQDL